MAPSTVQPPLVRGEWRPMTWEEFLEWSPSEGKSEWVNGRRIALLPHRIPHVCLNLHLGRLWSRFVGLAGFGDVIHGNVLFRPPHPDGTWPSARMPDIVVIGRTDADRVREYWFDGPVPLVVELVSEENADRDLVEKRTEYERAGPREYLIIDGRSGCQELTVERLMPRVAPAAYQRYLEQILAEAPE